MANEVLSGCAVRAVIQQERIRDQTNEITEQIQEVKRGIVRLQIENDRLRRLNHEAEVVRRTAKFLLTHTANDLVDNDYTNKASGCRVFTPPEIWACISNMQQEIDLDAEYAG